MQLTIKMTILAAERRLDVWCPCVRAQRYLHVKGWWQNILHTHTVISVTLGLHSRISTAMPRGDKEGHILGSYVTWAGPWWTWFYYTGPVSQAASQPASLRKKARREWRHVARKGAWLNGGKTSIPFSQSQSTETLNDAGCLQRPAGWNWVKEDPMSH